MVDTGLGSPNPDGGYLPEEKNSKIIRLSYYGWKIIENRNSVCAQLNFSILEISHNNIVSRQPFTCNSHNHEMFHGGRSHADEFVICDAIKCIDPETQQFLLFILKV